MRILAQTAVTPVMEIYNSKAGGNMDTGLIKLMRPVVQVVDDEGYPIYSTGNFYTPWLMYASMALVGLLGIKAVASWKKSRPRKTIHSKRKVRYLKPGRH